MIVNGWLDWAERRDGIPDKIYSEKNKGVGIACHSVVGDLPNHRVPGRFLSTDKDSSGRYTRNAAASSMFILYRDGHLVQMYPVTASTWTSGGRIPNTSYWAVEAEGGAQPFYGEPLTRKAEDTFIRLVTEWEEHSHLQARPGATIFQHKDFVKLYGVDSTACASDRYHNVWVRILAGERYNKEADVALTEEVKAYVQQQIALALQIDNGDDVRLAHFRKLLDLAINGGPGAFADANGNPLPLIRDKALVEKVEALTEPRVRIIPGDTFKANIEVTDV